MLSLCFRLRVTASAFLLSEGLPGSSGSSPEQRRPFVFLSSHLFSSVLFTATEIQQDKWDINVSCCVPTAKQKSSTLTQPSINDGRRSNGVIPTFCLWWSNLDPDSEEGKNMLGRRSGGSRENWNVGMIGCPFLLWAELKTRLNRSLNMLANGSSQVLLACV